MFIRKSKIAFDRFHRFHFLIRRAQFCILYNYEIIQVFNSFQFIIIIHFSWKGMTYHFDLNLNNMSRAKSIEFVLRIRNIRNSL